VGQIGVERSPHGQEGNEAMSTVSLRAVTAETIRAIYSLKVAPDQEQFVAPNAVSIAEAYFVPYAWFRAIYDTAGKLIRRVLS
jgi:hypothetical protein